MAIERGRDVPRPFDRALLLLGSKRDAVLELSDVQAYGADSFGDPDYVTVYGMPPVAWYSRGIRLLGRTAVECTRDGLAQAIAGDIARVASSARFSSAAVVLDPFLGSGNTLLWIHRALPGSRAMGFELDSGVYELTKRNLALVEGSIEIAHVDYETGLSSVNVPDGGLVVVFVAPPWGDALDPTHGLDLRRTKPPVVDVLDAVADHVPHSPVLFAIQVHEQLEPSSLADVTSRCDWTLLRQYDLNEAGHNHGVLLGTRRWSPVSTAADE